jgi:hypothetical protein
VHRLEENIGSAGLELTPDDLREIEDALPHAGATAMHRRSSASSTAEDSMTRTSAETPR